MSLTAIMDVTQTGKRPYEPAIGPENIIFKKVRTDVNNDEDTGRSIINQIFVNCNGPNDDAKQGVIICDEDDEEEKKEKSKKKRMIGAKKEKFTSLFEKRAPVVPRRSLDEILQGTQSHPASTLPAAQRVMPKSFRPQGVSIPVLPMKAPTQDAQIKKAPTPIIATTASPAAPATPATPATPAVPTVPVAPISTAAIVPDTPTVPDVPEVPAIPSTPTPSADIVDVLDPLAPSTTMTSTEEASSPTGEIFHDFPSTQAVATPPVTPPRSDDTTRLFNGDMKVPTELVDEAAGQNNIELQNQIDFYRAENAVSNAESVSQEIIHLGNQLNIAQDALTGAYNRELASAQNAAEKEKINLAFEKRIDDNNVQMGALHELLVEKNNELDLLESNAESAEDKLMKAQGDNIDMQANLDKVIQHKDDLILKNEEALRLVKNYNMENQDVWQENQAIKQKHDALIEDYNQISDLATNADRKISELQLNADETHRKNLEEIRKLKDQRITNPQVGLQDEIDALTIQMDKIDAAARKENDRLNNELQRQRRELGDAEVNIRNGNAAYTEAVNKNNALTNQQNQLVNESRISAQKQNDIIDILQGRLFEKDAIISQEEVSKKQREEDVFALKAEQGKLRDEIKELESQRVKIEDAPEVKVKIEPKEDSNEELLLPVKPSFKTPLPPLSSAPSITSTTPPVDPTPLTPDKTSTPEPARGDVEFVQPASESNEVKEGILQKAEQAVKNFQEGAKKWIFGDTEKEAAKTSLSKLSKKKPTRIKKKTKTSDETADEKEKRLIQEIRSEKDLPPDVFPDPVIDIPTDVDTTPTSPQVWDWRKKKDQDAKEKDVEEEGEKDDPPRTSKRKAGEELRREPYTFKAEPTKRGVKRKARSEREENLKALKLRPINRVGANRASIQPVILAAQEYNAAKRADPKNVKVEQEKYAKALQNFYEANPNYDIRSGENLQELGDRMLIHGGSLLRKGGRIMSIPKIRNINKINKQRLRKAVISFMKVKKSTK